MNKILIVDDEPSILLALESLLTAKGYKTATARDGVEGLEKAKRFMPNLILLDVMMPKVDGLKLAAQIRNHKHLSNIKIIFVTAKGEKNDKIAGYVKGGDDYVVKPFSTEQILDKIKYLLE